MKYPNRIFIKIIIQNLNKVCAPVKTNKQMLIVPAVFFQNSIILDSFESPTNVSLGYTMFESRFTELDINVHIEHIKSIPQYQFEGYSIFYHIKALFEFKLSVRCQILLRDWKAGVHTPLLAAVRI